MRRHALITVALAVLLATAGCVGSLQSGAQPATTPDAHASDAPAAQSPADSATDRTIHVVGSGSAAAQPNLAKVHVAVEATADDAATARQRLAENVTRMREALAEIGVEDGQITTRRYDIDRDRRRPREDGEEPRIQYRAWHSFEITVAETDRVGAVIDTTVQNGATDINNIQFTLSSDRRRDLERSARHAAMADARQQARSLATDGNLTVTGVQVIRTGGGAPRRASAVATETPEPTAAPSTELETGPVTVVATVQVVYNAAPVDGSEATPTTSSE